MAPRAGSGRTEPAPPTPCHEVVEAVGERRGQEAEQRAGEAARAADRLQDGDDGLGAAERGAAPAGEEEDRTGVARGLGDRSVTGGFSVERCEGEPLVAVEAEEQPDRVVAQRTLAVEEDEVTTSRRDRGSWPVGLAHRGVFFSQEP